MNRRALIAGLLATLAGCGPATLSTLDGAARLGGGPARVASAVPYGDHPRQRLDVYAPRGTGDAKRPVVVFFYGGAWSAGSRRIAAP